MGNEPRQDLPLDLVVIADLGSDGRSELWGRVRRLENDGLPALMLEARPGVTLESSGAPLRLEFGDLRAFRPEAVAPQLPEARALLELRRRLTQRGVSSDDLGQIVHELPDGSPLRQALSSALAERPADAPKAHAPPAPAAPPPAAPATSGDLEALFRMVEVGDGAERTSAAPEAASSGRALDRLVRLLGIGGAGARVATATQQGLAGAVDEALAETLRPALHHPRFQALEQTWMGLRFLMRRIDHRSGIRVFVLPARRESSGRLAREALVPFAEEQRRDARVVLAIADFDFGAESDLSLAADLAAAGASARTPVVAGVDPALLGLTSLAELSRIEDLATLLGDSSHSAWNALRDRDASRWLALAANRFLLRQPYGREHDAVKGFAFEENPSPAVARYLWGRASWLLAERVAASFARCGWGVRLSGQDEESRVADLDVWMAPARGGETAPAPLEALLAEARVDELVECGILPAVCRRDDDFAFFAATPMVHRRANAAPHESRRDSLAFAMFEAQISAWVEHLDAFGHFASDTERAAAIARGLEVLSATGEGPSIETRFEDGALHIAPWRDPLRGLPELTLPLSSQR